MIKKHAYILSFLLVSVIVLPLTAETNLTYKLLTIDELFENGIQNSLAVKSAILKDNIASNNITLAKNKRIADLQLNAQFGYVGDPVILNKNLSFFKRSKNPDWKQLYQLNIKQPLFEGGRIKYNIKRSEIEKEIATLSVEKTKSDLKLWLIVKYLDLYSLFEQLDIYFLNIKEAKERLENIKNLFKEGLITSNDVLRSQIQLTDNQLSYEEVQNDISLASQQLSIAMGADESLLYAPDSTFLNQKIGLLPQADYLEMAYMYYPDMMINNVNIKLSKNDEKLIKADFLPSLSLQLGNTFQRPVPNSSPIQDLYINGWGISLNVGYNFSKLFDRKHSLSSAREQININYLAQDKLKQDIRINIKNAYLKHKEALKRVDLLHKSVIEANENYRIVKQKYFNQLAILTDLLDANSIQLETKLQLTAARTNVIYTYYELLNLSGKL